MPALTPSFMWDLESNMRVLALRDYDRLLKRQWWPKIMKEGPKSESKKERVVWMLDTARIKDTGKGGYIPFEDIVSQTTETEMSSAAAGLKMYRNQMEDLDGNGVDAASNWSRGVGAYAAYWPQKKLAQAIRANPVTYDGLTFFNTAHPVNPFKPSAGTFANVFTGSSSTTNGVFYPGALKIDASVSLEQALLNLAAAITYITGTMKMPNGEDPRNLSVATLIVPPALSVRATQLTDSKFIASVAGTNAGGSTDIEAVIRNFGLGAPVVAPELGAAFGGSDTDFYIAVDEITSSDLGAFLWIPREDFAIKFYGPTTEAQLDKMNELEWHTQGRYGLMAGHPFLLFKCRAS